MLFIRDQLYFDRVHPSIPILHQRRYLLWSKSSTKTPLRICLQQAMWTIATLLSSQFQDLTESLYLETKNMLKSLDLDGYEHGSGGTELVQTWVLVATCESMRTDHRQAWMSAGQAFRLLQALRFHEIDSPKNAGFMLLDNDAVIETEEKRRVFWMAYFLDHLLSMRNDWPLTFNDQSVRSLTLLRTGCCHVSSQADLLSHFPTCRFTLASLYQMRISRLAELYQEVSYPKP